jgi:hypothetical protein
VSPRYDPDRDKVYEAEAFLTDAHRGQPKPPVSDLGHRYFELDDHGRAHLTRKGNLFSATAVSLYVDELRERLSPRFQVPDIYAVGGRGGSSFCGAPMDGRIRMSIGADVRRAGGTALEATVLHEVAHSLSFGDHHGPVFRETYASLLDEMLSTDAAAQFRRNFGKTQRSALQAAILAGSEGKPEVAADRIIAGLEAGVRRGIDRAYDGIMIAGQYLTELRDGPMKDLHTEQWDNYIKQTFPSIGSHTTASKWMGMARWYARARIELGEDRALSILKRFPPRWTTQYALLRGLREDPKDAKSTADPTVVAGLTDSDQIRPDMKGADVSRVIGKVPRQKPDDDERGAGLTALCRIVDGHLEGVSHLTDDEVADLARTLLNVLGGDQVEALRDLLADANLAAA